MQDDYQSLYAFNRWANDKMLAACRQLSQQQYDAEPVAGVKSVRATVYHIAIVTESWLRGLAGDPAQKLTPEEEVKTPDDAARILDRAYQVWDRLQPALTPSFLATPRSFQRRTGTFVVPPWLVLRHVVNHTTYHRGQVASKLKCFGIQQAETDMVYWARESAVG